MVQCSPAASSLAPVALTEASWATTRSPTSATSGTRRRTTDGDIEVFAALAGAELIWTWINTQTLQPGISVTMRHFGAKERKHFGCGDL